MWNCRHTASRYFLLSSVQLAAFRLLPHT
jgi:hypothetical protein